MQAPPRAYRACRWCAGCRAHRSGIVGDAVGIYLEVVFARGGKEAAVAGIADEPLVAMVEFRGETSDDRLAHGGVALGLLRIEANDVAARLGARSPIADDDLLDLDLGHFAAGARDGKRHHGFGVGEHDLAHLLVGALARAEDVLD